MGLFLGMMTDIIMKREDYERFLELAPSGLGGKYEVQHATTVPNYWSPFIKVRPDRDQSEVPSGILRI